MTDFPEIYKMCIGKIVKDLRSFGKFGEAEEYVNDGYMNLIESGKEVNFNNLYFYSRQSLHRGEVFLIKKETGFSNATQRVCACCNESVPVGYFGVTENKAVGHRTLQPYCRDCAKKYFAAYHQKNRQSWNLKERARYKATVENLTDAYVRKWLRIYGWQTEKMTANVISYARRVIVENRGTRGRVKKLLKAA